MLLGNLYFRSENLLNNKPEIHFMAPPLIIHIGLPKTGTTFLQKQVFSQLEGITYIGRHSRTDTRTGLALARTLRRASPVIWEDGAKSVPRLNILKGLQHADTDIPVLVSHENCFCRTATIVRGAPALCPVRVAEHIRWLDEYFWNGAEVRIVLSLRRQDEWLTSAYAEQAFKMDVSGQKDFEAKMRAAVDPAEFGRFSYLDYGRLVELLRHAVGEENLFVMLHEELKEKPAETLASLCRFIGLDEYPPQIPEGRENVRAVGSNRWKLHDRAPEKKRVARRLAQGREEAIELHEGLRAQILEYCRPFNLGLSRLLGHDLGRYGYT